ncbi:hypothetical protein SAMN04487951_11943 [Vreelandella arcis]|uniref:Uncharacterized protein n=2 Tax=Vreelandella arcis TaxID=416873 RepID=A0A1H0ICK7_9GAMM|nr:hypothetical protein SAMN04487951_11943 [Halomonas arcis]
MNKLESKTLRLRLLEENDADFFMSLRFGECYNACLSAVAPDVEAHKQWSKKNATIKLEIRTTSSLSTLMAHLAEPFECMTCGKFPSAGEA